MEIDKNAAMWGSKEILIAAPIGKVWGLEAGIDRWVEWQPDIKSAKLEGPLAVGSVFRWKAGGLNITSKLQRVEEPWRIGWTGDSIGMHAVHHWFFEPTEEGTRVTVEESLAGWLASLVKLLDGKFLDKSLEKSLEILKKKAEGEPK